MSLSSFDDRGEYEAFGIGEVEVRGSKQLFKLKEKVS